MKEDLKEIMSRERFTPTDGDTERAVKELTELIKIKKTGIHHY